MRILLSAENQEIEIGTGQEASVGRSEAATLRLGGSFVSRIHFVVRCTEEHCFIKDVSTNGTLVNSIRISETELRDGDTVTAGQATVSVRLLEYESKSVTDSAIGVLMRQNQPLYGVFDSARNSQVLHAIMQANAPYQSLYEGDQAQYLVNVAPYVIGLPMNLAGHFQLVQKAWGNSWGIYLTCPLTFDQVRKHLRRFLLIKREGGDKAYFRFYDPRVLRVFIPTCAPPEAAQFFGAVATFLMESENATQMSRFALTNTGVKKSDVHLRSIC